MSVAQCDPDVPPASADGHAEAGPAESCAGGRRCLPSFGGVTGGGAGARGCGVARDAAPIPDSWRTGPRVARLGPPGAWLSVSGTSVSVVARRQRVDGAPPRRRGVCREGAHSTGHAAGQSVGIPGDPPGDDCTHQHLFKRPTPIDQRSHEAAVAVIAGGGGGGGCLGRDALEWG